MNNNDKAQQSKLDLITTCTRAALYLEAIGSHEEKRTDALYERLISLLNDCDSVSNEEYVKSVIIGVEGEFNSTLQTDPCIALNQITNQLAFLSDDDKKKADKILKGIAGLEEKNTESGSFSTAINHFYELVKTES